MSLLLITTIVLLAVLASLFFSTLTYSLRDFSRSRLVEYLELHGHSERLDLIVQRRQDLTIVTAVWRLIANIIAIQ